LAIRNMAQKKIKSPDQMKRILRMLKRDGKKIVFTNGCFDILHVGHIRYLAQARKLGDILVVGLNTDRSVRAIKGEKRPIVSENERAEVLSALKVVDYVVLFDEPAPLALIKALKPTILAKGADWEEDKIIGGDVVKQSGGKVVRIPLVPGSSSTHLIEKIIKAYCHS
jgi:rfaE bifunctional protein nucleotidyltransferase chain/domain